MTTLNLTHSQLPSAKPYVALESEARWYGNSLWEFLVPNEATAGKLTVFEATMPEASVLLATFTPVRMRCSSSRTARCASTSTAS